MYTMGINLLFKSITEKRPNYKGNNQNLTGNLLSNSRAFVEICRKPRKRGQPVHVRHNVWRLLGESVDSGATAVPGKH